MAERSSSSKGVLPCKPAAPSSSPITPAKRSKHGVDRELLRGLLRQHFGHSDFRGLQLNAIEAVLSGKDCLCIMPTGGGKSICYEIPALASPGIVIVVSPLIALMENQVSALKLRKIPAEFLCSTQTAATKTKIYDSLASGRPTLKLLYVTPELLSTYVFMQRLKKLHSRGLLTLLAIDEAHCISMWGHDFRPSYKKLHSIRENLPDVPIMALTATAAKKVQEDVLTSLSMRDPCILLSSFNRPNIYYEVRYKDLLEDSYQDLLGTLMQAPKQCSIIYCHTRQTCNEIGSRLRGDGIQCQIYHAGVKANERSKSLSDWASGQVPVIVATVAFGMGIDRKDVRLVCHYNLPKSLEGFHQESGRAGRDQLPAKSILYYSEDDRRTMEFLVTSKNQTQTDSGGTEHLGASMKSFKQVVAYCVEGGCRRRKVLQHFGEQVSPSLCAGTCDACKWPDRVSRNLEALSANSTMWPSLTFQDASREAVTGTSEFWSYEDESQEEQAEEDDISGSEDEETGLAKSVAASGGTRVESRVAALLHAEEEFSARQEAKHANKSSSLQKKPVDEGLRVTALSRLQSAVSDAFERHGRGIAAAELSIDAAALKLEEECYSKFGRLGRSFYNSQVSSMSRWLSSCSPDALKMRISD